MGKKEDHGILFSDWENTIKEDIPIEIPISFRDLKLGKLKIDFEYDLRKEITEKNLKKMHLIMILTDELRYFVPFLKKYLELIFKITKKYEKNREGQFISFWFRSTIKESIRSQTGDILSAIENDIFEVLKEEGPILLYHPTIQEKILEWLSNEDIASVKLNKLKKSLIEYSLKYSAEDILFKVGRPKKDIEEKLGKENIFAMYQELTLFLKDIKKYKNNYRTDNIGKFITGFIFKRWLDIYKRYQARKKETKDINLGNLLYKEYHYGETIEKYIECDDDFKREFFGFRWEPNKLAKELLAKVLKEKVSTIENILYRKAKEV